jgi:hypothetical protein
MEWVMFHSVLTITVSQLFIEVVTSMVFVSGNNFLVSARVSGTQMIQYFLSMVSVETFVDKPGTSACHEVVMVTSYFPYSSEQS